MCIIRRVFGGGSRRFREEMKKEKQKKRDERTVPRVTTMRRKRLRINRISKSKSINYIIIAAPT